MDRGTAGVGKQIQKTASLRQIAQHPAGQPMIEEQSGIQIVFKIHQESTAVLHNLMELVIGRQFLILGVASLLPAYLQEQLLPGDLQHLPDMNQRLP